RLWDVLYLFATTGRNSPEGCNELHYNVSFLMENHEWVKAHVVTLKAVCGPGDNHEPVITLMLEDED
ncbi:MAG: DUF6573 family protein, partial [Methanosarcinales archaeon]|nr:DUF6573 family protein [Methanosarcinales archaeon]